MTLLLIEHDMDVALQVANRVVVMADGVTIAAGTPDEIRGSTIVRDVYLGGERRMSGDLLQVRDLCAGYGASRVLDGVSFSMGVEAVALIGRNGMGKTTLCNTIMGLVEGNVR